MIANNIAYIHRDGKHVPRVQTYRNRKEALLCREVTIDATGDISHKPIGKLACFASPIEYLRGEFDRRLTYKGEEGPPRWCAGCPSRQACGTFAEQRMEMDAGIAAKRAAWIAATQRLGGTERYEHPTFTEFATACAERGWRSDNEDALAWQRAEDAKRKRKQRAQQSRTTKLAKTATPTALAALSDERDRRHDALMSAARSAGAPTWLRNLSDRMIAVTCDVWQVREAMEGRGGREITGGDVMRALVALGRDHGMSPTSLRPRVNEAISRVARLEEQGSVWAVFLPADEPIPPRSPGQFLNGVIFEILDEDA
ncbi:hypothetical protein GCM10022253_06950 [Sphingomonas endophytica]|uniref:4Fe-4S Wbl-type domain-containing protein n=1 Tax=Sphingomonas endophytica TaxID=869719 RepID=A0ABR6N0U9_9SPHN|nr:hypothetical protein [Sphingomonas endophytica]MBB5724386.1 hypothetical protein [Sphingomonas endophytica]